MRLLIVDDSSFMRRQIKDAFSELTDVEFEEAINGIEALEKHRTFQPDVMILDYIIPAPDGLAILKILNKIDNKVKIVMVTALGNQKFNYKDSIVWGACAIISKPISEESASKIIKSIYGQVT